MINATGNASNSPEFVISRSSCPSSTILPENFCPGDRDVILGRGRQSYLHIGNIHLRALVENRLPEYSKAASKLEKSYILNEIVAQVNNLSPGGGFIRQSPANSRWYKVDTFLAKEKVSQAFRDALHNQYKSSNEYKKQHRRDWRRVSRSKSPVGDGSATQESYVSTTLSLSASSTAASCADASSSLFVVSDNFMHQFKDEAYAFRAGKSADMQKVEFSSAFYPPWLEENSTMLSLSTVQGQEHFQQMDLEPTPHDQLATRATRSTSSLIASLDSDEIAILACLAFVTKN